MTGYGPRWPDAKTISAIEHTLADAGFSPHDAYAWAVGWSSRPEPALVAAEAIAFDHHGVHPEAAIRWHQAGFTAYEALVLVEVGWKPNDAAAVRDLAREDEFVEWLALGAPAAKVLAYLRAGVGCREVTDFEAHPENTDETLGMLAALRT